MFIAAFTNQWNHGWMNKRGEVAHIANYISPHHGIGLSVKQTAEYTVTRMASHP